MPGRPRLRRAWGGGAGRYLVHEGGYPAMQRFVGELEQQERERGGRRWIRARLPRSR